MKQQIAKSYEDINKLGKGFKVSLNLSYLQLKEKELAIEYEYARLARQVFLRICLLHGLTQARLLSAHA
jgi:hypothetical protein